MAFKVPERYRVGEENKHVPTAFSHTLETGAALHKAPRRKRGFIPSLSLNP